MYGDLHGTDDLSHRNHPLRAPAARTAPAKPASRPPGARLAAHLWPAHAGDQLLKQLRALPLPGKTHPPGRSSMRWRASPCRCTAKASKSAIGSTSKTTPGRSTPSCTQGHIGATYNIGGQNEKRNIDMVRSLCALLDELQPRGRRPKLRHPNHLRRPTAPATTCAMRLMPEKSSTNWAGCRKRPLTPALRKTVAWYLAQPGLVPPGARWQLPARAAGPGDPAHVTQPIGHGPWPKNCARSGQRRHFLWAHPEPQSHLFVFSQPCCFPP